MVLDADTCYRALEARDARFDGLFFVAVASTGIYCRPVCPARLPARLRCSFFAAAAAAERAGYRPCLRCRPELAPGHAPIDGSADLARAIVGRIDAGALNHAAVDDLAAGFGLSARHMRRLVRTATGATPVELAQTRRLLLAKQLLTETRLPAIDVAHASGFGSVRRFNAAFRSAYGLTPGKLRAAAKNGPPPGRLRLRLAYRPPLAWTDLLAFLRPRCIRGVERVDGATYARTINLGGRTGFLTIGRSSERDELVVEVSEALVPVLQPLLARLRCLFDLDARPDVIDAHLATSPHLARPVAARPGLRVPGTVDGFELAWRAVLGQQVTVAGATTLAGRLARKFGAPIDSPLEGLDRLTPTPERVARATPRSIASIGLPAARARTLHALARFAADGPEALDPMVDDPGTTAALGAIPGVGPWTVGYIGMRALRWPDAFPDTDLGLRSGLGGHDRVTAVALRRAAEPWRPWRAYAAMHIWSSLASAATPNNGVRR